MIYLDNGATSFEKPGSVARAMTRVLATCANPGRGGYEAAIRAARVVYRCREQAAAMFDCSPQQVVFTGNCTQGLNMAIHSLYVPGARVAVSGFEHNSVMRPLHALGARIRVAGRQLFSWENTLEEWEKVLKSGVDFGVFTHVSNVFGYVLPVEELGRMCRAYGVPFILDAAQSAGVLDVGLRKSGAAFIAMPGHKGLLGPQGTGLLLCGQTLKPLLAGGTGTESMDLTMPRELPEAGEAGTVNVPGIAGLEAGLAYLHRVGTAGIAAREAELGAFCARGLGELGYWVFQGPHQTGTVSFLSRGDCEEFARAMGEAGIALRAGLHCAPLAHESAGTLETGTIRLSLGAMTRERDCRAFLARAREFKSRGM